MTFLSVLSILFAQTSLSDCPVGYADAAQISSDAGRLEEAASLLVLAETCTPSNAADVERSTHARIRRQRGVVQAQLAQKSAPNSRTYSENASGAVLSFYRALRLNRATRLTADQLPPLVTELFDCAMTLISVPEDNLPTTLWPCPATALVPATVSLRVGEDKPANPLSPSVENSPPLAATSGFDPPLAFWLTAGGAVVTAGVGAGLAVHTNSCGGCEDLDNRVLITNVAWGVAAAFGIAAATLGFIEVFEDD